jgi:UDP-sugar transporter A1/2/3
MSEIFKVPLVLIAIITVGGGSQQVVPVFREALSSSPFSNAWISLCYAFNNLLYFDALSVLSAVAYQVLSQSKTLFTAGLMHLIVGKQLVFRQLVAIAMLICGGLLVQLQELARAGAAGKAASTAAVTAAGRASISPVLWGAALVLFSSFVSALPNVAYERKLKTEGENVWVNNIQVTVWLLIWIGAASNFKRLFFYVYCRARGGQTANCAIDRCGDHCHAKSTM